MYAVDSLQQLVILEHFDQVVDDCFMDRVNCLIGFANYKTSRHISLRAIVILRTCEDRLGECIQVLVLKSSVLRKSQVLTPEALVQLIADTRGVTYRKCKTLYMQKFHEVTRYGPLASSAGLCPGTSYSSLWLPLDLVLKDAMDLSLVHVTSTIEILTGSLKTLQAFNDTTWKDGFFGLLMAALRLVQRKKAMDSDSWKIKWNEAKVLLQSSRAMALRRYGGLFLAGLIGVGGSLATTDIIKRHWKKEPSTGQKLDVLKMNTLALHQWLLFLKQDTELVKIDIDAIRREVAKHDFETRIYLEIIEGLLRKCGVPPPPAEA